MDYRLLSTNAGLLQIWQQVDQPAIKWIVSAGALASLTASMYGSMFPMPRVAFAMSSDGLLCEVFSRLNSRGVPACAAVWLGLLAAICAGIFPLSMLIKMMSIGTLLAYTLVDCCVLILR